MEFGVGIGWFIGEFVKYVGYVFVMDFMENFIKKVMKMFMDFKILCRFYVMLVLLFFEIIRFDNCSFFMIKGD